MHIACVCTLGMASSVLPAGTTYSVAREVLIETQLPLNMF